VERPLDVAISPDGRRAYVTNEDTSSGPGYVTVVDTGLTDH
jgi:DNA-binding beta-propeller fold protein YncE